MGIFVKICGLANAADIEAVAALRPDALGFVFWPKSTRAVRPEQVAEWTRSLPSGLLKVGVFVDEDAATIRRAVEIARLDVVQWHGFPPVTEQANAEFFRDLEEKLTGMAKVYPPLAAPKATRVWKVVRLDQLPRLENARSGDRIDNSRSRDLTRREVGADILPAFVDAVVLDSYSPASPGGTGKTVDWTAARDFVATRRTKVLLAGGLRPDNVVEAIRVVQPWGVDVSSGVEAQPGKKNLDAVKRFIESCRAI